MSASFRDIELLSAYLDGQLDPSEIARLESRVSLDPALASALDDLRVARKVLRQTPKRRAPRNFTLTRKMVGLNPPLPRAYPTFRLASAFAAFLFFITFAFNIISPRAQFSAAPAAFGYGGGSGGGCGEPCGFVPEEQVPAAATEAPAATGVAEMSQPSVELLPQATMESPPAANDSRLAPETAEAKSSAPTESPAPAPAPAQPENQSSEEALVPIGWQIALIVVALVCGVTAYLMRLSSQRKWK